MLMKRTLTLCALVFALSAASLEAQDEDLFVLPGSGSPSGEVQALVTSPLNIYRSFLAGVGSFAVLPNSNASEFFVVANSSSGSITALDATLLTPTVVANLPVPATQAFITPDGRLLAVSAGVVHLYSTATNAELVAGGVSQGIAVNTFAIAASLDSTSIFALGTSSKGGSQLSSISTSTYMVTSMLTFSEAATAVSVGPNGLVYVSLPNQVLELNPTTLQTTTGGTIGVSGTPGPFLFTPDGQYGMAINQSAFGNSLLVVSLPTHSVANSTVGLTEVSALQISGVDSVLALSDQNLYKIGLSPLNVTAVTGLSGLVALATTNDIPTSSHSSIDAAFLVSDTTVYQYNPATNAIASEPVSPNVAPGGLTYAVPPVTIAQSQPASLLTYGASQTIAPGATSQPLVVRVLDTGNVPMSGITVQFQSSGNGSTLSATSAITGSNGFALTYLTASSTTGAVNVTATTTPGSLSANFNINVTGTATGGGGPTLTIIAGQGQLMAADTSTTGGAAYGSHLQVLASAANGSPIANLPVTFSVPATEGTLEVNGTGGLLQIVNTNSAGVASVDFLTTSLTGNGIQQGYNQSLVTASATGTNSVTFYITTVDSSPSPSLYFLAPISGTTVTGPEGSTVAGAVEVQIISAAGIGIPNVSLFVTSSENPATFPSAACNAPGGVVLTSAAGIATCNMTLGPRLGSGTFVVTVGETHNSVPLPFKVTAGAASAVQITQGNNQTGGPGQKLPQALVVHVSDSGGNVVVGAPVTWQVVTAGTVTLSNVIASTDNEGNASALATLGTVGGVAQVVASVGKVSATFNLTVNIPTVGIQKISGDQQTAKTNTAFPLPLVVEVVDSNANGVPNAQVSFQVTSGVATLGASSATTGSNGQASTTVTAGATPGTITVTATSATFSVTFTLTAQPIGPSNITILNGASFNANSGISPGSIAIVQGMDILPGVQGLVSAASSTGQLPTTFSGVTITFNGTPAPIFYVDSTNGADSVTVQVPFEVQPGPAVTLEVSVANGGSASVMVAVQPLAPGVFTATYNGQTYASALRSDFTPVSPTNPAQRGENIEIYVTGLGQATPPIATGALGVANQTTISTIIVGLNNGGVPLISSVYAQGTIGAYVVTLQVPQDTPTGPDQPLGLIAYDSAGNAYFAQTTYIPIQ
jgi:uncharacterized protein (TIGR03437 family)